MSTYGKASWESSGPSQVFAASIYWMFVIGAPMKQGQPRSAMVPCELLDGRAIVGFPSLERGFPDLRVLRVVMDSFDTVLQGEKRL